MRSIAEKLSQLDVSKIMRLVETLQGSKVQYVRIEADGVDIIISRPDGATLQTSNGSIVVSSAATCGAAIETMRRCVTRVVRPFGSRWTNVQVSIPRRRSSSCR